jgi:hypothetical protein
MRKGKIIVTNARWRLESAPDPQAVRDICRRLPKKAESAVTGFTTQRLA